MNKPPNCMKFRPEIGLDSGSGGESTSATPSTAALNRRLGTSPVPRMLTRFEIDLLRLSKAEVAQVTREVFPCETRASVFRGFVPRPH